MARKIFLGQAVDVAQVATITASGTWAANDTATITIAGNDLVITVGTDVGTSDIATIISRAINAATASDNLFNDESRNLGGAQIPEMADITASISTADTSRVLLTGDIRGQPFSGSGFSDGLSVSETTVGTGALTLATATDTANEVQFPTGRNWFDNADNWDGDALPGLGDTIVFQSTDVDLWYAMDQSALTTLKAEFDASYVGEVGLRRINDQGTVSYPEWRPRFLKASWSTAEGAITIGQGPGGGSNLINLDLHTVAAKIVVNKTGSPVALERAALNIQGGASAVVDVRTGSVALGDDAGGAAVSVSTLHINAAAVPGADPDVYVGGDVTIATSILMNGGRLRVHSLTGKTIAQFTIKSGSAKVSGDPAVTNLNILGDGVFIAETTGAIGTLKMKQRATLDLSTDLRALVITNPVEIFSEDVRIIDPHKRFPDAAILKFNDIPVRINGIQLGEDIALTIDNTP